MTQTPKLETVNATISGTRLGIEDHGILTFFLQCDYKVGSQGFGGYSMDTYDKTKKRRVGSAYGTEYILRILDTVGVEEWGHLNGKNIRVIRDEGWGGLIRGIGHITKDKWFMIQDVADEYNKTEATT